MPPEPAVLSDFELVRGARDGDERAFETLVRRHQDATTDIDHGHALLVGIPARLGAEVVAEVADHCRDQFANLRLIIDHKDRCRSVVVVHRKRLYGRISYNGNAIGVLIRTRAVCILYEQDQNRDQS